MRRIVTAVMSVLLVLAMTIALVGCGSEEVVLKSREINGVTLNVPSDFGEFTEKDNIKMAANESSTASIGITAVQDAGGSTADAYDQEAYQSTQMSTYTDVTLSEFNNNAKIDGITAVYAHATGTNPSGVKLEVYNYILFFEDGTYQSIVMICSVDNDSSLKSNMKAVIDSIKIS